MIKLIIGPLAVILGPQAVIQAFFLFARWLLGASPDLAIWQVVVTGIALLISMIAAAVCVFDTPDGWAHSYLAEVAERKRAEEAERTRLRKQIDDQIGIPRIPVKR